MSGGEIVPVEEIQPPSSGAYDDRLTVSRPVYSQETFDATESARGANKRELRSTTQRLSDQLAKSCRCDRKRVAKFVLDQIPVLRWLPKYEVKQNLIGDLMAGFTISVLHLPQGMAYGMLAELPAINGLYTSFFPPLLYFFLGTSRHISLGTMAVVALMAGATTESIALKRRPTSCPGPLSLEPGNFTAGQNFTFDDFDHEACFQDLKKEVAFSLALLVGIIQICLGVLKFGFVATYMSEPLTKGFTTGAACYVFTAQVKYVTSIYPPKHSGLLNLVYTYIGIFSNISTINWASVITGAIMISFIFSVKKWLSPLVKRKLWKSMPMPIPVDLIAVILGTILSYAIDLEKRFHVPIVGDIPRGMPVPALPKLEYWSDFVSDAFVIGLVAFSICISVASILAKKNNYEINANQEFRALGITNAVSAFFSCHVSSASLSRSLLQETSGKTQLAAVFSSIVILVVLVAIGPLFRCLPRCVLASIIMVALRTMFLQVLDLPRLWKISKWDFFVWIVTFSSTILLDVPYGLLVGIVFSILQIIYRVQTPYACCLGRVGETDIYKDVRAYDEAKEIPDVKIVRFESFLFFGNIEYFKRKIYKLSGLNPVAYNQRKAKLESKHTKEVQNLEKQRNKGKSKGESPPSPLFAPLPPPPPPPLPHKFLILDCSAMNFLDYVGVTGLASLVKEFRSVGVVVLLSHCKAVLREMILGSGVIDSIAANDIFISNHDAVLFCLSGTQKGDRLPLVGTMTMTATKSESNKDRDDDMAESAIGSVSVVDENDVYVVDVGTSNDDSTRTTMTPSLCEGEYTKM